MAKAKKKSNVQITSVKTDSEVLKSGVETTVVEEKPRQTKKKTGTNSNNNKPANKNTTKKTTTKKTTNKKPTQKKQTPKKVVNKEVEIKDVESQVKIEEQVKVEEPQIKESNVLTPEQIIAQRKERNRRKYEKGQKKYREQKEKKRIVLDDVVEEKVELPKVEDTTNIELDEDVVPKETDLIKKITFDKDEKKLEEQERKEKRKTNVKTSGFTQTLTNIKELSVSKINDVREMTNDNTIPLGRTYDDQTKRSKRLIKEAIVYAIILTIINVLCIVIFDYFNFLRLFDVKWLNVVITILISLIFNFFVAFMVDYFITNVWLVKRRKKKDGEPNGDNWTL